MSEKIAIIDGNSLVFRAFYAIRNPMVTSRGVFTHAIYGFLNMLQKALEEAKPDYIAVAFDRKAPTFRHLEYDAYKAGRAKTPDELSMQLPYLKDILSAMNIAILEEDGFEADDLIGTLAKNAEAEGLEALVITGDRDELQLVSGKTSVLITKKGVSEFELYTPETMLEKYGFGADLFIDYKGLMGDSSDNIPGLPGVGEKTASKLVREFGTIENIIENLDKVMPERIRNIVDEERQTAFMSKRLATIITNVPIDIGFEEMRVREWDIARLKEIYTELEFRSLLKKLDSRTAEHSGDGSFYVPGGKEHKGDGSCYVPGGKNDNGGTQKEPFPPCEETADDCSGTQKEPSPHFEKPFDDSSGTQKEPSLLCSEGSKLPGPGYEPEKIEISIIDSFEGLETVRAALAEADEAVLHTLGSDDHVHEPAVDAIFIYVKEKYFCVWTRGDEELWTMAAEMLAESELRLLGYALKDDIYRIKRTVEHEKNRPSYVPAEHEKNRPSYVPAEHEKNRPPYVPVFDAGVANYLLAPGPAPTFAQLALTYGGIQIGEEPDFDKDMLAFDKGYVAELGRDFCAAVCLLLPVMRQRMDKEGLLGLFDDVEMPLVETLAGVESEGFAFDAAAMDGISAAIAERIETLSISITELAGTQFNINSPKQLGDILFEKLGLPGGKQNKNGYSTSADILEKLRSFHPIIDQVLEYRMLVKLKGTYIDGLPAYVSKDGKIRAHLMQTVTATGRLSCVDPNLQNIPIRKEPGRQLRKAFVPETSDYLLMGADYSQIELRVLAHFSGDQALIEDFRSGADIHSRTAARVFGVENEADVTPLQRSGAKAVNFGIIYGMSSFGLSEELSITRKDAEHYIEGYFKKHQAVKEYLDECVAEARLKGYSTTILGRRRPIHEIAASQYMVRQFGERLAMNSPVQGSAADIIKVAMNRVRAALMREGLASKLILQVHDELILQVKKGEEEKAATILKREMEGAVELKVPLEVEVVTGANWYELK